MLVILIFLVTIGHVISEETYKIVSLDEGDVKGTKYWNGDYYEFYGVKYASVPKGRDRYKVG